MTFAQYTETADYKHVIQALLTTNTDHCMWYPYIIQAYQDYPTVY